MIGTQGLSTGSKMWAAVVDLKLGPTTYFSRLSSPAHTSRHHPAQRACTKLLSTIPVLVKLQLGSCLFPATQQYIHTYTHPALALQLRRYFHLSLKVLVQELCLNQQPAQKLCSYAIISGLENPTHAPSVQKLCPHPLCL